MLGKLIKYDFRALSRTLFPLQIGVLSGGLLATLLVALTLRIGGSAGQNVSSLLRGLIMGVSATASVLIAIAIAASAFVTFLLVCLHFYNNFLGDEGYLTFTLPVTTGRLLWAKVIAGMLWLLINAAVILITILIFAVFGTTTDSIMNNDVLLMIKELFSRIVPEAARYVNMPLVIAEAVVAAFVALAAQLMEWYFAIVVGGQVAKKHRILAAIGMYLLINMGVGVITSAFTAFVAFGETAFGLTLDSIGDVSAFGSSVMGWGIAFSAGLFALFFLLSRSILKRNLNLQ